LLNLSGDRFSNVRFSLQYKTFVPSDRILFGVDRPIKCGLSIMILRQRRESVFRGAQSCNLFVAVVPLVLTSFLTTGAAYCADSSAPDVQSGVTNETPTTTTTTTTGTAEEPKEKPSTPIGCYSAAFKTSRAARKPVSSAP
jgi:hypothetical protein